MLTTIVLIMLAFFALGTPVALAMGLTSFVVLTMVGDVPLQTIPQRMITGTDSFPLMAIPFFLLAGNLMSSGGITMRLINFASAIVGHVRGGLVYVVIVTNMIMAGMSGSAVADAAATGSVLIPAMEKAGYNRRFAASVVGAASTIGPIIPPSVPFVVFGAMSQVSIGRLFFGGAVPGILMGIYMMVATYFLSKRRGYPKGQRVTCGQFLAATRDAVLPLMLPVIILGGILGGVFTPTEAAVVAAVYAFVLGTFVYREIGQKEVVKALLDTGVTSATVMFIIASANILGWIMAREQAGELVTQIVTSVSSNPAVVLLMINIILLILGCLVDSTANIILLTPLLMPLIKSVGIDPVHFGVVMVLNLMIGLMTPPVGMTLYVMTQITGIRVMTIAREALVFILALVAVLFTITYVPGLVTFLPNLLMGK
ncbi:MAG: TRAP transporter large permease [Chloroflexi bacterium]|nr:TRAP transporter large permease [Chloroflexota bacterium]